MTSPISIVIPTYNEEKHLPRLLKSLKEQTVQPSEIIVSDAYSRDKTATIVKKYGYTLALSKKKSPASQRNYGAKLAKNDLLLFLDADVILPPTFIEETLVELKHRHLDIASCFVEPLSARRRDVVLHSLVNMYFVLTQRFFLHAPGSCIFVSKAIHKQISGFDESLFLGEDHDYVQRARRLGKFSYLRGQKIPVSVRRLEREGRWMITGKYVTSEFHLFFLGKIRKPIFAYKYQ